MKAARRRRCRAAPHRGSAAGRSRCAAAPGLVRAAWRRDLIVLLAAAIALTAWLVDRVSSPREDAVPPLTVGAVVRPDPHGATGARAGLAPAESGAAGSGGVRPAAAEPPRPRQ